MTPEERAAAIYAAFPANGIQYSYNGIVFNLSPMTLNGAAVTVTISAWTGAGNNKAFLPTDNPYTFVNPPLMVPDGGETTVAGPRGKPLTIKTYTRNDLAAAQQIVYDAVTTVATRLGWVMP